MTRREILLDGLGKELLGIEIAPYFTPLASKRAGYNCKTVDVFDTKTLRERGKLDIHVPNDRIDDIEDVDFVGSATELVDLIPTNMHGTFDYILSSHNFEHLANPIRFLQACEKILKPGGILRMAVPDGRACFDFFRPTTFLATWLAAYGGNQEKPTREQVFSLVAYSSIVQRKNDENTMFQLGEPLENVYLDCDLRAAYKSWSENGANKEYIDTHCTVMTPNSLRLLVEECRQLELIKLDIKSISDIHTFEFYIDLMKPTGPSRALMTDPELRNYRTEMLRAIIKDRHPPTPIFNVDNVDNAIAPITQLNSPPLPTTSLGRKLRRLKMKFNRLLHRG